MSTPAFVAIETGGTKIVCRIQDAAGRVLLQDQFPTPAPAEAVRTLAALVAQALPAGHAVSGVGVASFGPVDVNLASPRYGVVLETNKPGWSGFDLVGALGRALQAPVCIDTDVNAAALAEHRLGAGQGLHTVAYVTVGTGIGGGLSVEGRTLRGAMHPEIGHLRLRRAPDDDQPSLCAFHDDCAEGLIAGPAVRARLAGLSLSQAPDVQDRIVDYLGQLCAALLLSWSPQRIVMGGGVLSDGGLLPRIEDRLRQELNGYGAACVASEPGYLAPAALAHAGLEGAMLMARAAADGTSSRARTEDPLIKSQML